MVWWEGPARKVQDAVDQGDSFGSLSRLSALEALLCVLAELWDNTPYLMSCMRMKSSLSFLDLGVIAFGRRVLGFAVNNGCS